MGEDLATQGKLTLMLCYTINLETSEIHSVDCQCLTVIVTSVINYELCSSPVHNHKLGLCSSRFVIYKNFDPILELVCYSFYSR